MNDRLLSRFIRISWYTVIFIYLVIIAGAVVRATGSGMGCPDWPRCFGKVIPPTSVNELPENYKEIYSEKRKQKNVKLSKYLKGLGLTDLAFRVENDPSIYEELDFNASKTWTEYVNRLCGVTLGIFSILQVFFAARLFRFKRSLFWLSLINLVILVFQGWLGSLVVSTNLLPVMITVHMVLALAILAIGLYIIWLAKGKEPAVHVPGWLRVIIVAGIFISLIQIGFGTQVREHIDELVDAGNLNRATWIESMGADFDLHRKLAIVVTFLNLFLFYRLRNTGVRTILFWLMGIIAVEFAAGVIMSYFSVPVFLQPVHLVLASVMFGFQIVLVLETKSKIS